MSAEFKPFDLKLIKPSFDSRLTDLIIDLEHLRKKQLGGSTHPQVFFQLKHIFHTLESIGSARIEGNNTTITEYFEDKLNNDGNKNVSYNILEIQNIEKAMEFIEQNIINYPINKSFISELHKIIVDGLPFNNRGEGDKTPGSYRNHNIKISNSKHSPPEPYLIEGYMDEIFEFIKHQDSSKYDLLKSAIAHHRFVWVHPFSNGNGRTVRLFTYAMLIKNGFNVNIGRIINPTAIFCNNKNKDIEIIGMYAYATDYNSGYAAVSENGTDFYFIDRQGNTLNNDKYQSATSFYNNTAYVAVNTDGSNGFSFGYCWINNFCINTSGKRTALKLPAKQMISAFYGDIHKIVISTFADYAKPCSVSGYYLGHTYKKTKIKFLHKGNSSYDLYDTIMRYNNLIYAKKNTNHLDLLTNGLYISGSESYDIYDHSDKVRLSYTFKNATLENVFDNNVILLKRTLSRYDTIQKIYIPIKTTYGLSVRGSIVAHINYDKIEYIDAATFYLYKDGIRITFVQAEKAVIWKAKDNINSFLKYNKEEKFDIVVVKQVEWNIIND